VFVPFRPFRPSVMFVGNTCNLSLSRGPERGFTRVGSGLIKKHWTSLEKPARDKHSSLLGTLIIYEPKKLYKIGPRRHYVSVWPGSSMWSRQATSSSIGPPYWCQRYQTFYSRNLRLFVIN
jgi:hypothetical protein